MCCLGRLCFFRRVQQVWTPNSSSTVWTSFQTVSALARHCIVMHSLCCELASNGGSDELYNAKYLLSFHILVNTNHVHLQVYYFLSPKCVFVTVTKVNTSTYCEYLFKNTIALS